MVRRERLLFQPLFNRGNQIALWSNTYNVFPCPNAYLNSLERIQDPSKVFWNQYPEYWRWWIYSFEWHGFYKENYRTELRTDMRNVLGFRGWRKLEDFIRPSVLSFPTQGIFFLNLSCFSFLYHPIFCTIIRFSSLKSLQLPDWVYFATSRHILHFTFYGTFYQLRLSAASFESPM